MVGPVTIGRDDDLIERRERGERRGEERKRGERGESVQWWDRSRN